MRLSMLRALWLGLWAALALSAQAGGLFLWEARQAEQRIWLLGSIHLGKPEMYPLPAAIERAYAESSQIAVEADISDPAAAQALLPLALLPAGQRLDAALDAEQRAQLSQVLGELSLPATALDAAKPWFAAMSLPTLWMQQRGWQPQYGIDLHFLQRAKRDGKPVRELESVMAQARLLDGLSAEEAQAMLSATLAPMARGEMDAQLDAMLQAWRQGDTAGLQAVLDASMPDGAAMQRVQNKLFNERNRAMAERISALAAKRPLLVIVGAGHLVGPDNILMLLQARGFQVKQY